MSATITTTPPGPGPSRIASSAKELAGTVRSILWSNWSECAAAAGNDAGGESDQIAGVVIAKLTTDQVIKGPCPEDGIEAGGAYRFLGRWAKHHQYGDQFTFSTFCRAEPATRQGTVRYLVKLAPNIGQARACRLWDTFGSEAVATLRTNPQAVAAAGILTLVDAEEAAAELHRFAGLEATRLDLFGLLDGRGFPAKLIESCIQRWGAQAGPRIRRRPWSLLTARPKLPGCGFRRIDKLYLDLGGDQAALKRQMLAAWHALREDSTGHTWFAQGVVREAIRKAVGEGEAKPERAIALGVRAKWLEVFKDDTGQTWIAEAGKARDERTIAEKIKELAG